MLGLIDWQDSFYSGDDRNVLPALGMSLGLVAAAILLSNPLALQMVAIETFPVRVHEKPGIS